MVYNNPMETHETAMKGGCGDPECGASSGIHEGITFGKGRLDFNGFWEIPCRPCAAAWDEAHPDDPDGPAWPFDEFTVLRRLTPNWDGEGADPPNEDAILRAKKAVQRCLDNGIPVDDIDPDVLGGVAVFVTAGQHRVWLSFMNTGRDSMVVSGKDTPAKESAMLSDATWARILELAAERTA